MSDYPIRNQYSRGALEAKCLEGWAGEYIAALYNGKRSSELPPGGLKFVGLGALIVVPVSSMIIYLMLTLFSHQPPAFHGKFLMGAALTSAAVHSFFMVRVTLGYLYAQQDLVRYLIGLVALSTGILIFGLRYGISTLALLPAVGALTAAFMHALARSTEFTKYAELMRAKRLYLLKIRRIRPQHGNP